MASVLRLYSADGPVRIESSTKETTLEEAGAVTVETDGSFSDETAKRRRVGLQRPTSLPTTRIAESLFLKFLPSDQPIMKSLVEASEDEDKEVGRLAISGLHAVGDLSLIVPLLNSKGGHPRRSVARKRSPCCGSSSPEARLREGTPGTAPSREYGDDEAVIVEKLLVGYTRKEAGEKATYKDLVQLLEKAESRHRRPSTRALDNLMELTGRDELEYDPEKPEGKGLRAWKDLVRNEELKAAAKKDK